MKKIFTLLFSLGVLSSVFAQSQYAYARPISAHAIVISTGFRYNEANSFTRYERDIQLAKINEKYNDLLKSIISMHFLSAAQKVKLIHEIEKEKAERVHAVHERFNDQKNKYNDWYYDKNFSRIR